MGLDRRKLDARGGALHLKGWFYWRRSLESSEILEILKRFCSTSQVTDEAKEMLARNGCRVLGYNCLALAH